ncbi:MAG: DUF4197 domain-containing protein [Sediminibacterium sp.]|jgi:hypothetical protein|nr:DUF4197 domain-containing protein [Sediminibacterium sp.]
MRKICLFILLSWLIPASLLAQNPLNLLRGGGNNSSSGDMVNGLKEALEKGAQAASGKLSKENGFLQDAAVKILLPPEAQALERTARQFGLGRQADQLITSLNRAAETACADAGPIFINAIKQMNVTDAVNIVRGTDTAATHFLRRTTSPQLTSQFKPVIDQALEKTGTIQLWRDFFTAANRFSRTPVNTDLSGYVTDRALQGLFHYVAVEEREIRKNPLARTSDVLKRVFGN